MPKQCMINGNKPLIQYGFQDAAIVNRLMETKSQLKNILTLFYLPTKFPCATSET